MAFWIGIIIAAIVAYFTFKIGFYETWAFAFNTIVSIYLAIFLKPTITKLLPAANQMPCSNILIILMTAIGAFLILHGISYLLITSQVRISFPKILDLLGAGLLGFFTGLFIWSFASLLLFLAPISERRLFKDLGFSYEFQKTNIAYIRRFCDPLNALLTSKNKGYSTQQAIDRLLEEAEAEKVTQPADANQPPKTDKTLHLLQEPRQKDIYPSE